MIAGAGRAARRTAVAGLLVAVLVTCTATPAAAHGRGGDTTNYESVITSRPAGGLRWRVLAHDLYLELENRSNQRVIVLGYQEEPYLRFEPGGAVYRNERSPAVYLNRSRDGEAPPDSADHEAPPRWRRVADDGTYRWHDHRIHWMGDRPPAAVRADPDRRAVVNPWQVDFLVGGDAGRLRGELRWHPSRPATPWIALTLVIAALGVVAGARSRRTSARWAGLARVPAALLGVALLGGIAHTVDDVTAAPGPRVDDLVAVGSTAGLAVIVVLCLRPAWRGDDRSFAFLAIAGAAVAWVQGVSHTSTFSAPLLVTGMPDEVTRALTALSLGAGIAALAAWAVRLLMPSTARRPPPPAPEAAARPRAGAGGRRRRRPTPTPPERRSPRR